MKPNQLLYLIEKIISEECQCKASWMQHPSPVTAAELFSIGNRIIQAMEDLVSNAVQQEMTAAALQEAARK